MRIQAICLYVNIACSWVAHSGQASGCIHLLFLGFCSIAAAAGHRLGSSWAAASWAPETMSFQRWENVWTWEDVTSNAHIGFCMFLFSFLFS